MKGTAPRLVARGAMAAFFAALFSAQLLHAAPNPRFSDVIVAKVRPTLVLIWTTNKTVERIAAEKHGDALVQEVLADAAQIIVDGSRDFGSDAQSVELDLLYSDPGVKDPRYETESVASFTRVGRLSAAKDDIEAHGKSWPAQLRKGTTPPGLHVTLDEEKIGKIRAR